MISSLDNFENMITTINITKRVINELNGNSGTGAGLDMTDDISAPAKLLPFMFSNAIVIGPVAFAGIGTVMILFVSESEVIPDFWKIVLWLTINEKS